MVSLEGFVENMKDSSYMPKTKAFAKYSVLGTALVAGAIKSLEFLSETGLDKSTYIPVGAGLAIGTFGYGKAWYSEKKAEEEKAEEEKKAEEERINNLKKNGTLEEKLKYDKERFPASYKISKGTGQEDLIGMIEEIEDRNLHIGIKASLIKAVNHAYEESESFNDGANRFVVLEKGGYDRLGKSIDPDGEEKKTKYGILIYSTLPHTKSIFKTEHLTGVTVKHNRSGARSENVTSYEEGNIEEYNPLDMASESIRTRINEIMENNQPQQQPQQQGTGQP